MKRTEAIERLEKEIGERTVLYVCGPGLDASPLLDLPQFTYCISSVGALNEDPIDEFSIEAHTGRRDGFVQDFKLPRAVGIELFGWLSKTAREPCLVMSFAPSQEIETLCSISPHHQYLGNSAKAYNAFSSKTAVEAALSSDPSVRVMPWHQMESSPSRASELRQALGKGPIVVRSSSQQAGGSGHELIESEEQLASSIIVSREETISVAPYLTGYFHASVGGCVFPDGVITKHAANGGLIGLPLCTPYKFGYTGNDYGLITELRPEALDRLERATDAVGKWLHSQGYVGTYSFQGLINDDELYYAEISARFGGRSRLGAEIDKALDQPDNYLAHLMACLGMKSFESVPLREMAAVQPHYSQIHCRNLKKKPVHLRQEEVVLPDGYRPQLLPKPETTIGPGALLCTLRADQSVTTDGYSLTPEATAVVETVISAFEFARDP